jgi:6-pyruvoyl-tetrahydropterin synthase
VIAVKHNIEVAHRLYRTQGKCEAIHGHSMVVTARFHGHINEEGLLIDQYDTPLEFGAVKSTFRGYLDGTLDHHLLLNQMDPWAQYLGNGKRNSEGNEIYELLPGLVPWEGDPTTENIARTIFRWMEEVYPNIAEVEVWETAVNMASYSGGM